MRELWLTLLLAWAISANAAESPPRHFLFIGEPSAEAWQYLLANPQDRREEVSAAFEALGGEVLSYYFGLGNGRNYITVTIPDDNELVQAIYLMRMPTGVLKSYEVIELMPSDQMHRALLRSRKLIASEKTM
jgi:uncharacterized protein with GYD domain